MVLAIVGIDPLASEPFATTMRPTTVELEVARALIARVKAADPSIKRVDELLVCAAVACRAGEFGGVPTACARAMGKTISRPSQVIEWVARLEKQVQAYRAAVLRNDALRVVHGWLGSELPGCLTWAPVLGSLHSWQQVWTPNRLRRYEGAAHAERCSRPAKPVPPAPPSNPDGELSTRAFTGLACIALLCVWRQVDVPCTTASWRQSQRANVDFKLRNDLLMNITNAEQAASQRANVDFVPLIDHFLALKYATKYATKQ